MIRRAVPGDAAALAGLHLRAWHRAYSEFIDPERFGTLEERVARWDEILAQPAELGRETHLFEVAGRVAGFVSVGPAGDADVAGFGGLMSLYVDPPAQGAGVGGALLRFGVARLAELGYADAVLWVFEANEHARHVYERAGWSLDALEDTRKLEGESWWAPAVRYRRGL